eukprot:7642838-Pyramimonas_sp.AAC.1
MPSIPYLRKRRGWQLVVVSVHDCHGALRERMCDLKDLNSSRGENFVRQERPFRCRALKFM